MLRACARGAEQREQECWAGLPDGGAHPFGLPGRRARDGSERFESLPPLVAARRVGAHVSVCGNVPGAQRVDDVAAGIAGGSVDESDGPHVVNMSDWHGA